jgi:hypothetical protein
MDSLLLDVSTWDLCLDVNGNIAVAKLPYAAAQNAASAIKLFQGEYIYDTTRGVPYFQSILGRRPPLALARAKFVAAALSVPDVVAAKCFFSSFTDRVLRGQVQVEDINGQQSVAGF